MKYRPRTSSMKRVVRATKKRLLDDEPLLFKGRPPALDPLSCYRWAVGQIKKFIPRLYKFELEVLALGWKELERIIDPGSDFTQLLETKATNASERRYDVLGMGYARFGKMCAFEERVAIMPNYLIDYVKHLIQYNMKKIYDTLPEWERILARIQDLYDRRDDRSRYIHELLNSLQSLVDFMHKQKRQHKATAHVVLEQNHQENPHTADLDEYTRKQILDFL